MKDNKNGGLVEFFNSLLPDLRKRDLVIDMTFAFEEMKGNLSTMYSLDMDVTFKGDLSKEMLRVMQQHHKAPYSSAYREIARTIKTVIDNEHEIMKMIDATFEDRIIKTVMDYNKINVMKYLEAITYFNDFARNFLIASVFDEFSKEEARDIVSPVDKTQMAYVSNNLNQVAFAKVVSLLNMSVPDFRATIIKLEGHIFDSEEFGALNAMNGRKLDPHGFGFISPVYNPVYHIGLSINGYRQTRKERNEDELARLQLMIMSRKEQAETTPDVAKKQNLAKQIKYYSNRVNKLNGKLEDYIED